MKRFTGLCYLSCILGLVSCKEKAEPVEAVALVVGDPAPDFKFTNLATGEGAKLSDFEGKVVVAKFWWSKCPHCNDKMDHLQTFIGSHPDWDQDVVYLAVSIDPTLAGAKRHVAAVEGTDERSWARTLNVWHDSQGGESPTYLTYAAKTGVPVSYVIDRSGKITAIDSPTSEEEFDLDKALVAVLPR